MISIGCAKFIDRGFGQLGYVCLKESPAKELFVAIECFFIPQLHRPSHKLVMSVDKYFELCKIINELIGRQNYDDEDFRILWLQEAGGIHLVAITKKHEAGNQIIIRETELKALVETEVFLNQLYNVNIANDD